MPSNTNALKKVKSSPQRLRLPFWIMLLVLILTTVACGLGRSTANRAVRLNRLPTLTPTLLAAQAKAATPNAEIATGAVPPQLEPTNLKPISYPTMTPTPLVTSTPTPVPTATPERQTSGWSFVSTRQHNTDEGIRLYGEMINDTGSAQELFNVSGIFYNDQGQVIADENSTANYAPIDIIPPKGRVPFELTVNNIQSAAKFELWAKSKTRDYAPRQEDFEFLNVNQRTEEGEYCLAGSLANRGSALQDYLVIAAILYDEQGNVVSFGDDYQVDLEEVVGDTTSDFEICVDSTGVDIARYELQAWGL